MKSVLLAGFVLIFAVIPAWNASGHVLITDETETIGAVLHILPDDNPIAGEKATLYFDLQTKRASAARAAELLITNSAGEYWFAKTTIDGALVTADFTFPSQGVYTLQLTVTAGRETYVFSKAQRISRGTAAGSAREPDHAWAAVLLVISGVGLALLMITALNRRKAIAKQSTF